MVTVKVNLTIEEIIASLQNLDSIEVEKLQNALLDLKNEIELRADVAEGLADIENGRTHSHDSVMAEINAKYNYDNG